VPLPFRQQNQQNFKIVDNWWAASLNG